MHFVFALRADDMKHIMVWISNNIDHIITTIYYSNEQLFVASEAVVLLN